MYMIKRFSVNSEFFGGIIKNNLNKENNSIDKLFFDLLMIFSNNLSVYGCSKVIINT